jgi:hypothetical protein
MKKLLAVLESIKFYFKLLGLKGGINFAIGLICNRTDCIYSANLQKSKDVYENLINPGLNVRLIKNTQDFDSIIDDYAAAKGRILALKDRRRVALGKECVIVAYREGQFAGWLWARKGPLRYGNCDVSDLECAIVKGRTLRPHRRHGVFITLLVKLQQRLAEEGFRKVYGGVKPFNKTSVRGLERAGFEFVEECDLGSFASRLMHHLLGKGPKVMQSGD